LASAPPRLAAAESSSTARAYVRKVELIGDVDKSGGATRGDAPAGDEQKKARQKLLHLNGGGKLGRVAKKFGGEIFGIIMGVLAGEIGSGAQGEVTEAETELGIRARKAAALTVGETMVTARWLTIDFERGWHECGTVRVGVHCFGEGVPPHMTKNFPWRDFGAGKIGEMERFEEFAGMLAKRALRAVASL
jgi:hypothetical protein